MLTERLAEHEEASRRSTAGAMQKNTLAVGSILEKLDRD
jgi:hypothetical protein